MLVRASRYWPEVATSLAGLGVFWLVARGNPALATAASVGGLVMLASAVCGRIGEDDARWWRLTLLALCNALVGLLTYYWVMADGLVFTRDFGESFSIFLAAHNARDYVTLLLQDMSTDREAVGHPFLYTHQPSLVARVHSIALQALGLGIPANMALNFLAGTLLLWTMANALSRHLPWPVVAGGAFFAVSSYTLFHESIIDLTRAPGYFALLGGMTLVATDPHLHRRWSRIGVATATAAAAATDFAVGVFVVYVLTAMHLWLTKTRRLRTVLLWFIAPCVTFYGVYLGTVAAVVGVDFLVMDTLFSFLGPGGHLRTRVSRLGWIPNLPDDFRTIPALYHEAGIVLWQRLRVVFQVRDLVEGLASSWRWQATSYLAMGMALTLVVSLSLTVVGYHRWRLFLVGSLGLVAVVSGLKLPMLLLIPIPVVFAMMVGDVRIPSALVARLSHDGGGAERVGNALALTAISAMGLMTVASLFPAYGIDFLIRGRRGVPGPLLEMLSFGLLVYAGYSMIRRGPGATRSRTSRGVTLPLCGILLLTLAVGLLVTRNLGEFLASPPRPPAYARVLAQPEFRHKPFISTSFYGQTWYFTRGWVYMVPNPPMKPFADYWDLRHVRDWENVDKYSRPHYFLCDNTHLKGYPPKLPPSFPCSARDVCNCEEVAAYMRMQGYAPVIVRQDFAIVDVRNAGGLLHRGGESEGDQADAGRTK